MLGIIRVYVYWTMTQLTPHRGDVYVSSVQVRVWIDTWVIPYRYEQREQRKQISCFEDTFYLLYFDPKIWCELIGKTPNQR